MTIEKDGLYTDTRLSAVVRVFSRCFPFARYHGIIILAVRHCRSRSASWRRDVWSEDWSCRIELGDFLAELQRHVRTRRRRWAGFESFEPRRLLSADPIISEFMSDNDGQFTDGDGNPTDWIEIHNRGDQSIDLSGWHLTDDVADPVKFTFPSVTLDAGAFVVVFASGLSSDGGGLGYLDAGGNLHTNFRLSSSGEYLALVQPDGRSIASSFGMGYPPQREGVAYGVDQSSGDVTRVGYLPQPTPGAVNGEIVVGYIEDLGFDVERGFYDQAFDVTISSETPAATIVFTTDGSIPTLENGTQVSSDGMRSTAFGFN